MRPNIFPVLRYDDARAAVDWLTRAFGFETVVENTLPDGTLAHVDVRYGAGLVGIGPKRPASETNPWTSVRHGIYVWLPDVDAHHARAQAAGATIVMPLRDTEYGSREYSALDVNGHLWGFGSYIDDAARGEPDIYPELRYRSVEAIAWLANAFGFESTAEIRGKDGAVFHAEMRLGDGTIFLNIGAEGDGPWGNPRQAISVRLDDPDAHFERACAAGATIVQPPATTPYGARAYWARDPEGFLWGFSTYRPSSLVPGHGSLVPGPGTRDP